MDIARIWDNTITVHPIPTSMVLIVSALKIITQSMDNALSAHSVLNGLVQLVGNHAWMDISTMLTLKLVFPIATDASKMNTGMDVSVCARNSIIG